jgi:hypothetical protein
VSQHRVRDVIFFQAAHLIVGELQLHRRERVLDAS